MPTKSSSPKDKIALMKSVSDMQKSINKTNSQNHYQSIIRQAEEARHSMGVQDKINEMNRIQESRKNW